MKPPQHLVLIAGQARSFPLPGVRRIDAYSDGLTASLAGEQLTLDVANPGREWIVLEFEEETVVISVAAFRDRECFIVFALSTNFHEGWDPSLMDRMPHPQTCGPDKSGNGFRHLAKMERIIHEAHLLITWLIDAPTAAENRELLLTLRQERRDEFALMPSSRSHFNPTNWNTERTLEETVEFVRESREALEEVLGFQVKSLGIDQFIGSVGSHFTAAAAQLGFNALWGMGYDHAECDTSMHHFGCPWDCYRPSRKNFRIPSRDAWPLWLFPWTARDLINTVRVPGGMSGAVMFSTDVDDILACKVAEHDPGYYERLADNIQANDRHNEFLTLVIHQEDHDAWNPEGIEIYRRFLESIAGFTPATMGEVADWLDLKYPHPRQPSQTFRLEDPLHHKEKVEFVHPGVNRPADWGRYPAHIFHWDVDRQLVYVEEEAAPLRVLDYKAQHEVPETGAYPCEPSPGVTGEFLDYADRVLTYDYECKTPKRRWPLAVWTQEPPPPGTIPIVGGFIVDLPLRRGWHHGEKNLIQ